MNSRRGPKASKQQGVVPQKASALTRYEKSSLANLRPVRESKENNKSILLRIEMLDQEKRMLLQKLQVKNRNVQQARGLVKQTKSTEQLKRVGTIMKSFDTSKQYKKKVIPKESSRTKPNQEYHGIQNNELNRNDKKKVLYSMKAGSKEKLLKSRLLQKQESNEEISYLKLKYNTYLSKATKVRKSNILASVSAVSNNFQSSRSRSIRSQKSKNQPVVTPSKAGLTRTRQDSSYGKSQSSLVVFNIRTSNQSNEKQTCNELGEAHQNVQLHFPTE